MCARKVREITVETEELLIIRRNRAASTEWCEACSEAVEMLRPERAAAICGVSTRTIYRRVESQSVHYIETPDGLVWICPNSLGIRA
jgi:hypothetical protein